jgi:streptomycin 6-kinase
MTFAGKYAMTTNIPARLVANCCKVPDRQRWLEKLPDTLQRLKHRWSLGVGEPFDSEAAWVAPVTLRSGIAVLKLGMPHFEGEHEIHGMRFWNGDPTVRVLEADEELNALLLERCDPGTTLREIAEEEQDVVISRLLRRLWLSPSSPNPFRPLSVMMEFWSEETLAAAKRWPDAGLVRDGLQLFRELPRTNPIQVLLATDLHAGNILRAEREPWLVIDPKPFVGDPAYDATQHLMNCPARMRSKPRETIDRFADLLSVDRERVRLWTFARVAAEPRERWNFHDVELARTLA